MYHHHVSRDATQRAIRRCGNMIKPLSNSHLSVLTTEELFFIFHRMMSHRWPSHLNNQSIINACRRWLSDFLSNFIMSSQGCIWDLQMIWLRYCTIKWDTSCIFSIRFLYVFEYFLNKFWKSLSFIDFVACHRHCASFYINKVLVSQHRSVCYSSRYLAACYTVIPTMLHGYYGII